MGRTIRAGPGYKACLGYSDWSKLLMCVMNSRPGLSYMGGLGLLRRVWAVWVGGSSSS